METKLKNIIMEVEKTNLTIEKKETST